MNNENHSISAETKSPSFGGVRGGRIIMAGGGTGGHIFPAIAIANALKGLNGDVEILFVGARGKMEMEKVPQAGYKIEGLDISGFNRSSLIKNLGLPFKLVKSFFQVKRIFKHFKPDAVIGVGGYSSFPVLRYAQMQGIKTFIHESNSFAGRSNRLLGKKATKIFVATDGMEAFFPAERLIVTGNPVRPAIANAINTDKATALAAFGLQTGKPTVLVVGGSLGARSINEAVDQHLDDLVANDVQVIWQTGKLYTQQAAERVKGKKGIWAGDFIAEMDKAYAAADVVISRAGAMSVAELCVVGKPVVFVPYPFAAEDHQTVNAMHLVNKGAALMIKDSEAKEKVVPMVLDLIRDEGARNSLKVAIAQYAVQNADVHVATEVLKSLD